MPIFTFHCKSMETLSCHSNQSAWATAIKKQQQFFVEANAMNNSATFQVYPLYGFWVNFFTNLAFLLPWQPIKLRGLDKNDVFGRELLKEHFCKAFGLNFYSVHTIITHIFINRIWWKARWLILTISSLSCKIINGPRQANLVLIAYASSEGSGEPAHPRNIARTSAARSYKKWVNRNSQTGSQIHGPSEWLGMRS